MGARDALLSDPLSYSYCYCEENASRIALALAEEPKSTDSIYLLFISNPAKSVVIWHQGKSGVALKDAVRMESDLVVWDFHVTVLHRIEEGEVKWHMYDLDSRLSSAAWPVPAHTYLGLSFRSWMQQKIPGHLKP